MYFLYQNWSSCVNNLSFYNKNKIISQVKLHSPKRKQWVPRVDFISRTALSSYLEFIVYARQTSVCVNETKRTEKNTIWKCASFTVHHKQILNLMNSTHSLIDKQNKPKIIFILWIVYYILHKESISFLFMRLNNIKSICRQHNMLQACWPNIANKQTSENFIRKTMCLKLIQI